MSVLLVSAGLATVAPDASDWQQVVVEGDGHMIPMQWYGEYLWRANVPESGDCRICATDAAGNQQCSDVVTVTLG